MTQTKPIEVGADMTLTREIIKSYKMDELGTTHIKRFFHAELCDLALKGLDAEKLASDREALLVALKNIAKFEKHEEMENPRHFGTTQFVIRCDDIIMVARAAIAAADAHDTTKQETEVK